MSTEAVSLALPSWAQVNDKRRAHILRVTGLLIEWADAMRIDPLERQAWIDAGLFHDALKDAPVDELKRLAGSDIQEVELLHGPAAASYLEQRGEARHGLLNAIRYHSIGYLDWDRTGRALFMADFLEPGRRFSKRDRAFLAAHVPHDFDGVFTQVVRTRLEWSLHEGHSLFPDTVALWNALR